MTKSNYINRIDEATRIIVEQVNEMQKMADDLWDWGGSFSELQEIIQRLKLFGSTDFTANFDVFGD